MQTFYWQNLMIKSVYRNLLSRNLWDNEIIKQVGSGVNCSKRITPNTTTKKGYILKGKRVKFKDGLPINRLYL